MSRRTIRAGAVIVAGATGVAWLALAGLDWPARAMTAFLLVPLPALLLAQARLIDAVPAETDREAVYLSSAVSVWILAALAMLAARFSGFTRAELRLEPLSLPLLLAAAAATVAAGLGLMAAGRFLRLREKPLVRYLMPRTTSEKIAFAGVSVSAGIAEELVFRSFLIGALLRAGASPPLAVVVSVMVFALVHAYQGVAGTVRVAILGAVVTVPLLLTDSVYPSIIAHAALNLLAGLVLARWLLSEDGGVS